MRKETGKRIKATVIYHYKNAPEWQTMIEKYRADYESKICEEGLASKRKRVQELSEAYYRLKPNDENLVDATNVLAKIKDEVEGKALGSFSITQYNQYNNMSDEDLRKIIVENTRFLEINEKNKQITLEGESHAVEGSEG